MRRGVWCSSTRGGGDCGVGADDEIGVEGGGQGVGLPRGHQLLCKRAGNARRRTRAAVVVAMGMPCAVTPNIAGITTKPSH